MIRHTGYIRRSMKNLTAFFVRGSGGKHTKQWDALQCHEKDPRGTDMHVIKVIWRRQRITGQYTCINIYSPGITELMYIHAYYTKCFLLVHCSCWHKKTRLTGKGISTNDIFKRCRFQFTRVNTPCSVLLIFLGNTIKNPFIIHSPCHTCR